MRLEYRVRLVAGAIVLIGTIFGWFNRFFLIIPLVVGAGLVISAFTKWCLIEQIIKKLGWGEEFKPFSPKLPF